MINNIMFNNTNNTFKIFNIIVYIIIENNCFIDYLFFYINNLYYCFIKY